MHTYDWQTPPSTLTLVRGEVHVWEFSLDPSEVRLKSLESTLNSSEIERAARFRRDILQTRFKAGRGLLRMILGRYLDQTPESIQFDYGPQGKPELLNPAIPIKFNLAHSKGIAVCAVTLEHAIGVDIETDRSADMAERIMSRFCSAFEQSEFFQFREDQREDAFLRAWTRKEAFIKAIGLGLAFPLDDFDVSLGEKNPKILRVGDDPEEAANWNLVDLPTGDAAALAIRGALETLRLYRDF